MSFVNIRTMPDIYQSNLTVPTNHVKLAYKLFDEVSAEFKRNQMGHLPVGICDFLVSKAFSYETIKIFTLLISLRTTSITLKRTTNFHILQI